MAGTLDRLLARWLDAGIIDPEVAGRIRAFEAAREPGGRSQWPVRLALGLGALTVGCGVLLFVAAHWDTLSPGERFATVIAGVGIFHGLAGLAASRTPALADALHAVGTVACGAGVFLAGQIFNMAAHWPSGFLLWAIGAAVGWALLRSWPQLTMLALLAPLWLLSEWALAAGGAYRLLSQVASIGTMQLALAYILAKTPDDTRMARRVLHGIGMAVLMPALAWLAGTATLAASIDASRWATQPAPLVVDVAWTVALGAPIALALVWCRRHAWVVAAAGAWGLLLLTIGHASPGLAQYAWWSLAAAALVTLGLQATRIDVVNLGAIVFAGTVVTFYFSAVMSVLDRALSLTGLGVLLLAGGWLLERARRRVIQRIHGGLS